MPAPKILIYVEDPGAANMVLDLTDALTTQGAASRLLAGSTAETYLRDRGMDADPLPFPWNPVALIKGAAPDVFVIGTAEDPDTPAFALAEAARNAAIPTVCLIDGPANADKRLKGRGADPLTHLTDWLFVPDDPTRDAFVALDVATDRIRLVGNPALDRVRAEGEKLSARDSAGLRREVFPDLPADSPLVLFLTELSDGLDPTQFHCSPDYTLTGRGHHDGRTEIVLEEVLDAAAQSGAQVALRLHPKTSPHLYSTYTDEIAAVSSGGSAYPALCAADLVVGLSTALLTEAAVMGLPVLSVLPRKTEAQWLAGGSEMVPYVSTRDALRTVMASALDDPKTFMAGQSAGFARTGAAPRIARALAKIAAGKQPAPDGSLPYTPPVLKTPRLVLEPFPGELLTERYVGWLNDPEIVRYSEQRHRTHTLESCREFIESFAGTPNGLWAIRETAQGGRHIGNISTEIDPRSGTGDIRILIGERDAWGTGLGAEAWMAVMAHLFDDLGLVHTTAGTLEDNRGMRKIMEKTGMTETHREPGPTPIDGQNMDMIYVSRSAQNWHETR
ncbi:MAG: GNAT family N-acetyltransferase [Rhodospirillales bacterium]